MSSWAIRGSPGGPCHGYALTPSGRLGLLTEAKLDQQLRDPSGELGGRNLALRPDAGVYLPYSPSGPTPPLPSR
jgi:hypothetical protein